MWLFEREQQLCTLHGSLRESCEGTGRVVLLRGPSGCGKTTLMQEVMQTASTFDAACLEIVCSRDEQLVPFGAARELFRNAALPDALAASATNILANWSPTENCSEQDGEFGEFLDAATVSVFDELCRIMLACAERTTVVIGIDDVHHADALSVRFFRYLALRTRAAQVLFMLGELSTSNWMYSRPRSEIERMPHARTVAVGPLSPAGVSCLSGGARHSNLLWAVSGGNPLLAHALLRDFDRSGPRPGTDFAQALVSCLGRMGLEALRLACALAVLGAQASTALLARLLDVDIEQAALIVEAMNSAGVADTSDGVRFRHFGVGEVLLGYLPSAAKAQLHHRAARVLYECGSSVTTVAGHVVKSGWAYGPWAIEVLTSAADRAMLDGRAQAAVEFLEPALQPGVQGRDRRKVVVGLVHALWQLDPERAARHLGELVVAAGRGQLPRADLVELVRLLLWKGRLDEAASLVAQIRQATSQRPNGPVVRETELWLGCVYPSLAEVRRPGNRLAQSRIPSESGMGGALSVATALSEALGNMSTRRALSGAEQVLRRGCRNSPAGSSAESVLLALLALVYAGEIDSAQVWCDKLSGEAIHARTPLWQAVIAAIRAEIALYRGEFADAAEFAEAALARLTRDGWGVAVGVPLGCLVMANVRMGRLAEAAEPFGVVVPDALFSSRYGLHYLFARGQYHLAAGEEHASLSDFLTCRDLMQSWGLERQAPVQWRLAAAEVWYIQGNRGQARRLAREQLMHLGPAGSRARGVALRLLAAVEDASRRLPLLTESVELLESCGDRFELARAVAELSQAHQESGRYARARIELLQAAHLAERCGAQPLHRELLASCIDLGITLSEAMPEKAKRWSLLTDAEQRVAALASRGYTNREIAKRLFVTPSTVEQHLTRVYRKLTIKRRKDLATILRLDLANTA
ncbi:MAG TPA: AAA family ATPase [Amycolatopsis sp.]|uniref:helix-turn-helix transcriptional regulator n=1 Tax=Amycolatopsis sp. TaxID=37632 RepID=UPI002B45A24C|nr:AAA family ATPase [Amycolatopsis sp.]HKS48209.1 AAA family ATPase [Amycolatopsis sp.]